MITKTEHPVAWAMLVYELNDAREHLQNLVNQMADRGSIDETDFRVQLGHVYSHLNCAWHRRDNPNDQVSADLWDRDSRFPDDITPV